MIQHFVGGSSIVRSFIVFLHFKVFCLSDERNTFIKPLFSSFFLVYVRHISQDIVLFKITSLFRVEIKEGILRSHR